MKAVVLGTFVGESSEELTLEAGLIVDVIAQSDDGWWDIQYGDQIGIFPYTYLRLVEEEGEGEEEEEVEEVVEEVEEEEVEEDEEIVEVIEEIIEVDDMEDGVEEIIEERTYIVDYEEPKEEQQNEIEENDQTEEQQPRTELQEEPEEEQPKEEQQINEPQEEQPQEENNVETEEEQPQQQVEIEQKPLRSLPPIGGAANRGQPVGPQRGNFNPNTQRGAPINRGSSPGVRPLPSPNSPQRGGAAPVRGSAPPRGGQPPPSGSLPRGQPISRGVSPNTPPRGGASPIAPSSPANNNNNVNNRGSPQLSRGGPGNRLSNNNLAGRALPSPGSQQPPQQQQQVQSQVPTSNPPANSPLNAPAKVLSRRAAPTSNRVTSLSSPHSLVENIDINDEEKNNNINTEEIKEENNIEIIENNNQETPADNNVNNDVEMSDDERSKLEQHRRNVVDEIITTEKDYCSDLEIVVKVFINPLQEKGLISRDDIQTLFSNLSVILSVNKEVARLFETRSDEEKDGPLLVGDIFLKMADFFKMYTTYCANQPKALSALDRLSKTPAFAEFLQESLLNPETRALTLFSFLIKPIQRICKYPLLLRDLLKHTEKNHPDYANLDNALNKINEVVEYVNERKRLAENLQKILEIQNQIEDCPESLVSPSRRFMREGTVNVFEKGRRQQRKMFVFNDLIVLTKEQKSLMGNALKDHFKGKFHLNEVKLVEMADTNDVVDACEVRPKDPKEKALILVFASTAEKRAWLKEVKMLVREFQKKEAQAAKEALLKKAEEGENGPIIPDFTPSSSDSPKAAPRNALRNTMPNISAVSPVPPLVKQNSVVKPQPPAGHKAGQRATPLAPPPPPPTKKSSGSSIFGKKNKDKKEEKSESPKQKKTVSPMVTPSKLNNQFSKELAKTLQKKQN